MGGNRQFDRQAVLGLDHVRVKARTLVARTDHVHHAEQLERTLRRVGFDHHRLVNLNGFTSSSKTQNSSGVASWVPITLPMVCPL